jgi:hypothetical protein
MSSCSGLDFLGGRRGFQHASTSRKSSDGIRTTPRADARGCRVTTRIAPLPATTPPRRSDVRRPVAGCLPRRSSIQPSALHRRDPRSIGPDGGWATEKGEAAMAWHVRGTGRLLPRLILADVEVEELAPYGNYWLRSRLACSDLSVVRFPRSMSASDAGRALQSVRGGSRGHRGRGGYRCGWQRLPINSVLLSSLGQDK